MPQSQQGEVAAMPVPVGLNTEREGAFSREQWDVEGHCRQLTAGRESETTRVLITYLAVWKPKTRSGHQPSITTTRAKRLLRDPLTSVPPSYALCGRAAGRARSLPEARFS